MDDYNEDYYELDITEILEEYRKQRMFALLVGPLLSLSFHVVLIVLLVLFVTGSPKVEKPTIEINIIEDVVDELEVEEPEPEEIIEEVVVDQPVDVEVETTAVEITSDLGSIDDFSEDTPQTDDDMNLEDVLDVEVTNSPLKTSWQAGGNRNAGRRGKAIGSKGGKNGRKVHMSTIRVLNWLKHTQQNDGAWTTNKKHAMTSYAVLCFLAHGETPTSAKYGECVRKGIDWLCAHVRGDTIDISVAGQNAYSNSLVLYALSEAYAMTEAPKLEPIVTSMSKYIISKQDARGGWDYGYKVGERTDMSLTGWTLQAIKAAYASGVDVDGLAEALSNGIKCCETAIHDDGTGSYIVGKQHGKLSMGAAAGLFLQLVGEQKSPKVSKVYKRIIKEFKKGDMFKFNGATAKSRQHVHNFIAYNWYYQAQVVFMMEGKAWKKFNSKFIYGEITKNQKRETVNGIELGYWDAPGQDWDNDRWERYYNTCLNCLVTSIYYRLLPSYKFEHHVKKEDTKTIFDDTELSF